MGIHGRADGFLETFFSRIPADTAASFSEPQLAAIRMAFGARTWGSHPIDIRRTLRVPGGRLYLILLIGRERRSQRRLRDASTARPLWTIANAGVVAGLAGIGLLCLAGLIYTIKMALGIDVFPGIDMLPDRELGRIIGDFFG